MKNSDHKRVELQEAVAQARAELKHRETVLEQFEREERERAERVEELSRQLVWTTTMRSFRDKAEYHLCVRYAGSWTGILTVVSDESRTLAVIQDYRTFSEAMFELLALVEARREGHG